jgi:hypothetical protein
MANYNGFDFLFPESDVNNDGSECQRLELGQVAG